MHHLTVITPPDPIVTPEDMGAASGDAALKAMIQAVTEEIDGPGGWLGRALGPQTLELRGCFGCGPIYLPCPPTIEVVEAAYRDGDGVEQILDAAEYVLIGNCLYSTGGAWPTLSRIRYKAGYDGQDAATGGTGPVPERAKQAIILAVRNLQSLSSENLFLRSEEVEGIGTTQYTVSDVAGKVISTAVDRLLMGLRVYR
jgi:hypothetical protein